MSQFARVAGMACSLAVSAVHPVVAQEGKAPEQKPAYAVTGPLLSFYNTPNRKHTIIGAGEATPLGRVALDLAAAADVMVLFTSGITTVTPEGCPCSVRASLQVDGQEPVVIKRINLSGANTVVGTTYQPDRQSLDGNFVFSLPAGKHEITLIAQRIEGDSKQLYAFYQNIQAVPFNQVRP